MCFNLFTIQYAHLDEEVEHVIGTKVKEAGFAEPDVVAMLANLEKYARSHGDPFVLVPYMIRWIFQVLLPNQLSLRKTFHWQPHTRRE